MAVASPAQQQGPLPPVDNKVSVFPIPSLSHSTALHPWQCHRSYSPYPNPQHHQGQSMVGGARLELCLHPLTTLCRVWGLWGGNSNLLACLLVTGLMAN